MASGQRLYVGPSLRRIRRDRGLTQSDMAADLEVSPSYIALLERNHRPLSAELLLRLAQTYQIDMSTLADNGSDDAVRLQNVLKDPLFADIELPSLETTDVVTNFPGIAEAFLRLFTAYQEEHLALADRGAEDRPATAGGKSVDLPDPVAESRRFWLPAATVSHCLTRQRSAWPKASGAMTVSSAIWPLGTTSRFGVCRPR